MIDYCEQVLADNLIDVIDTHNTTSAVLIFQQGQQKYVLKIEYGQNNATSREVAWYKTANLYPLSLTPKCIDTFTGKRYSFIVLSYIKDAVTLDDGMAAGTYPVEKLLEHIHEVLMKDMSLYARSRPKVAPKDVIDSQFLGKFARRRKESSRYAYLDTLFSRKSVAINGVNMPTPTYCINRIANNDALQTYITPSEIGLIHGDLHCGNVLINDEDSYLVDPNGSLLMPIEYDYGKLLHSVHGAYGQIMRRNYRLKELRTGDYEFSVTTTSAHDAAFQRLQSQLNDRDMLRGLYAEALHFATMLPHHATKSRETTALFLRCTELFNQLFEKLNMKKLLI